MPKTLRDRLIANKRQIAPVAGLLGMRLVRQGRGRAVMKMRITKRHLNTLGTVHGGILCDLSDAAMGHAFTMLFGKRQVGMTIEFKINFLKPAFEGETLEARARVVSRGNTLHYAECTLRDRKKHLIARAAATCKIL